MRLRYFFVLIILVVTGILSCPELRASGVFVTIEQSDGEEVFRFNLLAADDYRKAFYFLKRYPEAFPSLTESFFQLLDTWRQYGDKRLYEDALQGLVWLVERNKLPGHFRRKLLQGAYTRLGEYHQTQRAYMQAVSVREKAYRWGAKALSGENVEELAALYKKIGMYEAALRIRRKQLTNGGFAQAELWRNMVTLYLKMGKVEQGIRMGEPSEHPARRKWLAEQLWEYKYLTAAEKVTREVLEKGQENLQNLLAKILFAQKKFEASLDAAAKWYVAVPMAKERPSNKVQKAGAFVARVHEKLGTLNKAIDATEVHQDLVDVYSCLNLSDIRGVPCISPCPAVLKSFEAENAKKRLRVLRSHFYARNNDYRQALKAARKYSRDILLYGKLRENIRKYARKTFLHLLKNGRLREATMFLEESEKLPWDEPHVKCAKYHLRMYKYGDHAAGGYFMKIAFSAAASDEKLGKLATVFDRWQRYQMGWRLWRLITRNADKSFVYELQARNRLAGALYRRGKYDKALDYVEYVHGKVEKGWGKVNPRKEFLRFYAELRYLANGKNPDVLIPLARNGELIQRRCAIEQLGKVGKIAQARILNRYKAKAPPVLHKYIESAVNNIQGRHLRGVETSPITSEQNFRERLPEGKTVRWIKRDPYEKSVRWAAVADHFVIAASFGRNELRRYRQEVRWLRGEVPEARHIAFTKRRVWVGTASGLFAYERESDEWHLYAVGGESVACEIKSLEIREERLCVAIRTDQAQNVVWRFSPEDGHWEKTRDLKEN